MSVLSLTAEQIPLLLDQAGLDVDLGDLDPTAVLTPSGDAVFDTGFDIDEGSIRLGQPESVKLGVKAGTRLALVPLWKGIPRDEKSELELDPYLTDENLLLALIIKANGEFAASASGNYSVVTVGATLDAGADASYACVRPYPRETPVGEMVVDLAENLALPGTIKAAPNPGEVTAFEYGGYLKMGLSLGAGYEMKGSADTNIGDLKLSEHYKLNVIGQFGVKASVAGRYRVAVRHDEMNGWARVTVTRSDQEARSFAADVGVSATLKTEGLPDSDKAFLGALLGVEVSNWINMVDRGLGELEGIDTLADLGERVDDLAIDFLSEWLGKTIDDHLDDDDLALIRQIREKADEIEDSVLTLVGNHLDRAEQLASALDALGNVPTWEDLEGEIDPFVWNIVTQLTDGDPLGWSIVPEKLDELKGRVQQAMSLLSEEGNRQVKEFIELAKTTFGIDTFLAQLEAIDSVDEIKAIAQKQLGHFIQRLTGKILDESEESLKPVLKTLKRVRDHRDRFAEGFKKAMEAAAEQSFEAKLSYAYSRTETSDALIDVSIRLHEPGNPGVPDLKGRGLLKAAARGDFAEVLAKYDPKIVRIRKGSLVHNLSKESALKINVSGWHLNWQYEGIDRVILNSEQLLEPGENGSIDVFTTVTATSESERRRRDESRTAGFMLQFLGETRGVVDGSPFDEETKQYLIETITGKSIKYDLSLTDEDTSEEELREYLLFAAELGLDARGATFDKVAPLLERKDDGFGEIETTYAVRYTEAGLSHLFTGPFNPRKVVEILKQVLFVGYVRDPKDGYMQGVAWCFVTEPIYQYWVEQRNTDANAFNNSSLEFNQFDSPLPGIPARADSVILKRLGLETLQTLFRIRTDLVDRLEALHNLVASGGPVLPEELEEALGAVLSTFRYWDGFDNRPNSLFAIFDELIAAGYSAANGGASIGPDLRASTLELTSRVDDQEKKKVFMARSA